MNKVLRFNDFINEAGASYSGEWPLNKQEIGVTGDEVTSNPQFAASENKFQQVQEYMKILLKPILVKKNPNADDNDVEKVSDSFFRLGNNKSQEIKQLVDACKDTKQCAKDIINKYLRYVKINFNAKDNVNNVEQDSVMSSESIDYDELNEGKLEDVITFPTFVRYGGEDYPGFNYPKRYIGKRNFKYRVLAREGQKVKPINFGNTKVAAKPVNRLSKKYWEAIPYYR
jgi:hypothetical protein